MLDITVLSVGRVKEKGMQQLIEEYSKRLGRYAKLHIIEVPDEKTPDGASEALEEQIKRREGERLLQQLGRCRDAYVICLAIEGKQLSSEELAARIDRLTVDGVSHVVFIIGGSLGLSPEVLGMADMLLSFSRMTFPHQLMRVILLEQVYRSFRIINNEPYHK